MIPFSRVFIIADAVQVSMEREKERGGGGLNNIQLHYTMYMETEGERGGGACENVCYYHKDSFLLIWWSWKGPFQCTESMNDSRTRTRPPYLIEPLASRKHSSMRLKEGIRLVIQKPDCHLLFQKACPFRCAASKRLSYTYSMRE